MKAHLTLAFALLLACTGAGAARALGTPDHLPPALETVCDMEHGAAFGLCNAYCEAMDCELANDGDPGTQPHASATACSKVRSRFQQITGRDLPCEVTCPCNEIPGPFHDTVTGVTPIVECFTEPALGITDGIVAVTNAPPAGFNFSALTEEGNWSCGFAGPDGVLPLTPEQGQACADLLEHAANSQGVSCVAP